LTRSRHGMGLSERRGTGVVCSAVPFYMDGEGGEGLQSWLAEGAGRLAGRRPA
jgi:hypothetical protein